LTCLRRGAPGSVDITAIHLLQRLFLDGELMHRSPVLTDSHGGLLAFVRGNWYLIVCDPCGPGSTGNYVSHGDNL